MLKNAKNYEEEVKKKLRDTWYDPTYQYYHSRSYFSDLEMNDDSHYYFVSCVNDKVVGFLSYRINRAVNSVSQFGAISFEIGNPVFARDIVQAIDDIFHKYHFNRLEWYCIDGNPVADYYLKFAKEHGGTVMAVEHECVRTLDGDIRGSIGFEILAKNYTKSIKSTEKYKEYKTESREREEDRTILASMLDDNEYGHEMTKEDIEWAKEHNLVVVFGASDDLMEFRGAIDDETGCFGGDIIAFTKNGIDVDEYGEYIGKNIIEACWSKVVNGIHYSWSYKTDIPHSTFEIWDGGEAYCLGIVFCMEDLK